MKPVHVRVVVAAVAAALVGLTRPARAQQEIPGSDGEPRLTPPRDTRLFANRDAGSSGLRAVGTFRRVCVDNFTGIFGQAGCTPYLELNPAGFVNAYFRGARWGFGVPSSQWVKAKALVPELANIVGATDPAKAGWTVNDVGSGNFDDTGPADGTLGIQHAGVASTNDRTCRDHTENFGAGRPLLAGSDCPETWGSAGFVGARPIPLDAWVTRYNAAPATNTWDWWRVTDAEVFAAGVDPNKFLGNFQTYLYSSDYGENVLCGSSADRNYAHILPASRAPASCASADPTNKRTGWPLGIEIRTEAFTFQLPAIKDVAYYQVTFTNRSKDLYGVGIDYDSLYISLLYGVFSNLGQQALVYNWTQYNARVGMGGNVHVCDPTRNITDIRCDRWPSPNSTRGFDQGAMALVVLKSPIGDTRNKLYTTPGSPFFNPGHPHAGDTLTYNHAHMCGFRNCGATTYAFATSDPEIERRVFGMMSSTEENVYGTRNGTDPTQLSDFVYWHTFRNIAYPTRWTAGQAAAVGGGFNKYVPPGGWDWNKDGVLDTLHYDDCHLGGCVVMFSDTLPNGKLNGYSNTHGNAGVGPITLMADSTVGFIFAITAAGDSASIMAQIPAAVDHYLNFYLGPEAAPKCRVAGVTRAPAADSAEVRFIWNDDCFPGRWTDPFLAKQANDIATAPATTALGRLRQLNPWLDDTLADLAVNNLAALHVFKSCTDGADWTDDADCTADPALAGPFQGIGYLPLATFSADAGLPTSFTDRNVLPGLTYTYNIVGETRGAAFTVLNGDSVAVNGVGDSICVLNCRIESLSLAPVLINPLSPSTGEPNVVRAYMPMSLQAGGSRATVRIVDSIGPMTTSRVGVLVTTDDSIKAAQHRVVFGDSANAQLSRTYARASGMLISQATRVIMARGTARDTIPGTNAGGFTVSGTTAGADLVTVGATDSTVVTPYTFATGPIMTLTTEGAGGGALLVSNTLTGDPATPGTFHGNVDYPGFDISVDRGLSNRFGGQTWRHADGSVVTAVTEPTVAWSVGLSRQDTVHSGNQANGEYITTWGDRPFGPGEPFRLNFADKTTARQLVLTSLTNRAATTVGATDAATAATIAAAGNPGFTVDSLEAVRLPFAVNNTSYGRTVTVAMRKRPGKVILIGTGADTVYVTIPDNVWVPGDQLFLLEQNADSGKEVLTFSRAVIACDSTQYTRTSCNPLAGLTAGSSVYLGATVGQAQHVTYQTPITHRSQFTLQGVPVKRGVSLASDRATIVAGLASVRAVPNPYIMLSQYTSNVLRFTHVPPKGTLRIYTVAGQFVQQINWDDTQSGATLTLGGTGDISWNLRSREGTNVAAGLYVFVITALDASGGTIGTHTGKFVIIR